LARRVALDWCGKTRPPPGLDPRNFKPLSSRYSAYDSRYSAYDSRYSAYDSRYSAYDSRYSAYDIPAHKKLYIYT